MSVGLYPRRDLARDDRTLDGRTLVPRHEVGPGNLAGDESVLVLRNFFYSGLFDLSNF